MDTGVWLCQDPQIFEVNCQKYMFRFYLATFFASIEMLSKSLLVRLDVDQAVSWEEDKLKDD